jgi:hypothetical protein
LRGPNSGAASERLIIRAAVSPRRTQPAPIATPGTANLKPEWVSALLSRFGMISMSARIEAVFGWL